MIAINFINIHIFIFATILVGLIYSMVMGQWVIKSPNGNARMQQIASSIKLGTEIYLNRQYRMIGFVGGAIAFLLAALLGIHVSIGFVLGAVLSGISTYASMNIAVHANIRTSTAAQHGLATALTLAFRSATVTGVLLVSLALVAISSYYGLLSLMKANQNLLIEGLLGLGFGASLMSVFTRLGGGIFTEGADLGAQIIEKSASGMPENDPRNPAVIADNVGDNVSDCAGMAADLFETYIVTMVATMILAKSQFIETISQNFMTILPPLLGGCCLVGSIIGMFFVRLDKNKPDIMTALYRGLLIALTSSAILCTLVLYVAFDHGRLIIANLHNQDLNVISILLCVFSGLGVTAIIAGISQYYTKATYRPVRTIAKASIANGHTSNIIIQGVAVSMEATALPALIIIVGMVFSFNMAGLFGVAIAASTMLSVAGFMVSFNAYGAIADNADGIAKMAELSPHITAITDCLDIAGNSAKAITKAYAIASAALAAIALFSCYTQQMRHYFNVESTRFDLQNPYVMAGLILGASLPYLFSSRTIKAVKKATHSIVTETQTQFIYVKEIIEGSTKADCKRVVDMLTRVSIQQTFLPASLPVIIPILAFFTVLSTTGLHNALVILGAILPGAILTGLFMAISMTSGGAAWDNAKKYIEAGHYGGTGSHSHHITEIGDMVGDIFKNSAGSAINPMVKIINIVALLILAMANIHYWEIFKAN
ncbi:MAG: sodium-translocating pyrophosphatase [Alphaproteobacteria bacterium]